MLIYDGDCGICTRLALWSKDRLPEGTEVAPWDAVDLDEAGLTMEDVTTAAYWLDPDGTLHRGHEAIAVGLLAFGGLWAVLGRLMAIPPISWLAAGFYRVFANNRYRFPGSTCPTEGGPASSSSTE